MNIEKDGLTYFSHDELCSSDTGLVELADGFAKALLDLRLSYGMPMTVTSCCRSKQYNESIGGHPRSLHVYDEPEHNTGGTCAIDVARPNGENLFRLISLAVSQGWSVGLADTFVHLDRRVDFGLTKKFYTY